jgi:hypothetical protein
VCGAWGPRGGLPAPEGGTCRPVDTFAGMLRREAAEEGPGLLEEEGEEWAAAPPGRGPAACQMASWCLCFYVKNK